VPSDLHRRAKKQRSRQREIAGRDNTNAPFARERVDLLVVRRRETARAGHDVDAALESRENIRPNDSGMCVVNEHIRANCVECLRHRGVAGGIRARDASGKLQVAGRLDGGGDSPTRPARDAGDADPNHELGARTQPRR
jgi:hypothetical protein